MTELEPKERPGIRADIVNPAEGGWNDRIDSLRLVLGSPENPYLFPPHFVKRTLISIGGSVIEFRDGNELLGAGFLFPRRTEDGMGLTLRFHGISSELSAEKAHSLTEEVAFDANGEKLSVHLYIPSETAATVETPSQGVVFEKGLRIQRTPPSGGEMVRDLQRRIWEVTHDDFLYPADIHSVDFALPTSLVAFADGQSVGFLFGFDKACLTAVPESLQQYLTNTFFRLESQLTGVLDDQKGNGIARTMKQVQAREARLKGVEIINWTYDPLLSENAQLNINGLGGLIWEYHSNYYAFSGASKLNQMTTARFIVNWFISSPRVEKATTDEVIKRKGKMLEALKAGEITVVNTTREFKPLGGKETRIVEDSYLQGVDSASIMIEIPTDWVLIQEVDKSLALQWRLVSDAIFQEYIGLSKGKYVITDIVTIKRDGLITRAFLVGRSSSRLEEIFLGKD